MDSPVLTAHLSVRVIGTSLLLSVLWRFHLAQEDPGKRQGMGWVTRGVAAGRCAGRGGVCTGDLTCRRPPH